ncbi:MAG TPA: hydrolase [Alphaproteobacteria bacterium]|jgi:nicotinamidase-related amidase|nr:hydrolase [Alphaproteobacteria bacterium]
MLIERDRSCLLLIDVQERLLASMDNAARLVSNCAVLLKAAARLGVPVLASEQYPKGLGPTVPELAALVPEGAPVTKTEFSCAAAPGYLDRLRETGRDQLVLAGIEAHVCVLQTALQLRDLGYKMFVVADAVSSRKPESAALAVSRMRDAGVVPVTTEMVLFEWLGRAGTPEFKELSALIK